MNDEAQLETKINKKTTTKKEEEERRRKERIENKTRMRKEKMLKKI